MANPDITIRRAKKEWEKLQKENPDLVAKVMPSNQFFTDAVEIRKKNCHCFDDNVAWRLAIIGSIAKEQNQR